MTASVSPCMKVDPALAGGAVYPAKEAGRRSPDSPFDVVNGAALSDIAQFSEEQRRYIADAIIRYYYYIEHGRAWRILLATSWGAVQDRNEGFKPSLHL